MAKVISTGKRFKVVNSSNLVPVGTPNTFMTMPAAQARARQVRCRVLKKCG